MVKLYSRFWVTVTIVLSVVFAVLIFREVEPRYGPGRSILLTAVGVAAIWVVYFVRAYIFSRMGTKE